MKKTLKKLYPFIGKINIGLRQALGANFQPAGYFPGEGPDLIFWAGVYITFRNPVTGELMPLRLPLREMTTEELTDSAQTFVRMASPGTDPALCIETFLAYGNDLIAQHVNMLRANV